MDCCLFEPDGLVIVDYKTDRISAAEAPERAGRYACSLRATALGHVSDNRPERQGGSSSISCAPARPWSSEPRPAARLCGLAHGPS